MQKRISAGLGPWFPYAIRAKKFSTQSPEKKISASVVLLFEDWSRVETDLDNNTLTMYWWKRDDVENVTETTFETIKTGLES